MTLQTHDSAVAAATGEDFCDICRRGFRIADSLTVDRDAVLYARPRIMDWDALDLHRNIALFPQRTSHMQRRA